MVFEMPTCKFHQTRVPSTTLAESSNASAFNYTSGDHGGRFWWEKHDDALAQKLERKKTTNIVTHTCKYWRSFPKVINKINK